MSGDDEDVRDRLNQRFDDKPEDDPDPEPQPEAQADSDAADEDDDEDEDSFEQRGPEFAADVSNVKKEWAHFTVYLPPKTRRAVDKEYQRLAYETAWDFKKGRHYHPLLLHYGLSVIESLEGSEVSEYLRRMDQ